MKAARIVIMGLGSIGSKHVDTLLSMGCCELVAVDPRPMPHEDRLPVLQYLDDLGAWRPTHALICSPPDLHYPHARYFLQAGIPTFIEKPMTAKSYEAIFLNEVAKNAGTYLGVGYMERAHPVVQEARRWAIAHEPDRAEVFCYWRAAKKTYTLEVMRESSHAIDTALYVMGSTTGYKRRGGSGPRSCVMLEHGKAQTEITMDMDASPRRRIKLFADGLFFEQDYGTSPDEWTDCYRAELHAFLDGTPLCDGRDGLAVVDVLEALS